MVNVGTFYEHLEYSMAFLWPIYGRLVYVVCGHLVFFPNLVCLEQEKSGNTD
jgi:hypothetical protein